MKSLKSFIFLALVYLESIRSISAEFETCVTLYSQTGFNHVQGLNVSLKDGSRYGNLKEEYFEDSLRPWNTTGSFTIQPGCQLTACSDSYFRGECKRFDQTVNNLKSLDFETFSSLSCSCQTVSISNSEVAYIVLYCEAIANEKIVSIKFLIKWSIIDIFITQTCSCSDVKFRKSGCAYSFLGNGCDVCDPVYFDLKGSKDIPKVSPMSIKGIKVRGGCSLTVYDNENFEGNSTVFEGSTMNKVWPLTLIHFFDWVCNLLNSA